jgi:hypothetical protein
MPMNGVVPPEELLAVSTCVLDRPEALREIGLVFQGFELSFRVRIVVRDVRPAVGLSDIQVDEESCDGFGAHAGATVSSPSIDTGK